MKLLRLTFVAAVLLGAAFGSWSACGDVDADGSGTSCSGGWLDPVTSLCWQEPVSAGGYNWDNAVANCAAMALGYYGPGSWRLPTISELRSLIRGCPLTETGGACNVTDACLGDRCRNQACRGCSYLDGPGAEGAYWPAVLGGEGDEASHWSSSESSDFSRAWLVQFYTGSVDDISKTALTLKVRCVRRGP